MKKNYILAITLLCNIIMFNAQTIIDVADPVDNGATGYAIVNNELFFASGNGEISKIDITATLPATVVNVVSGLSEPEGIIQVGNDLYFCQAAAGKISKIDFTVSSPIVIDVITGLDEPTYLALDGNDLYFSEINLGKVLKVDITSSTPTIIDVATGLNVPLDLELNGNDLYIVEVGANKVSKIDITASLPATPIDVVTGLTKPLQLELVGNDLYIAETDANKVSKINITASLPTTATDVITGVSAESLESNADALYFSDSSSTTANEGKIAKINFSTLSTNYNFNTKKINIYPNPTSDYILVSETNINQGYAIYDISGKKVLDGTTLRSHEIDVRNLANGMYFLKYVNSIPTKFIKE